MRWLAVIALVLLAAGGALFLKTRREVTRLHADRTQVGPNGKVELHLTGPWQGLEWQASAGVLAGKGPRRTWLAPRELGPVDVKLLDGKRVVAQVRLEVVALDAPALASGYRLGGVHLDRTSVCRRQSVRVQLSPVDPAGDPTWVTGRVMFEGGPAVEGTDVVVTPTQSGTLVVQLLDTRFPGVHAESRIEVAVRDCDGEELEVQCHLGSRGDGEVRCEAGPRSASDWTWIVPGGEPVASGQPRLVWQVPAKLMQREVSSQVIEVQARAADGRRLSGRASVVVPSDAWIQRTRLGQLKLSARFDAYPREVEGGLETAVTLANPFDEPVRLDAVWITRQGCDRSERREAGTLAMIGVKELPALGEARFVWQLPREPERCGARLEITGEGVTSGLPAQALVLMPTAPGGRSRITSGPQLERLHRALEILSARKGEPVTGATEEELAELEKDGLIPPLPVEPPGGPLPPGAPLAP